MSRAPSSVLWRGAALLVLGVAVLVTVRSPGHAIEGDSRIYVQAAESIPHGDYRSDLEPTGVPRYPPGLPLLLVPAVGVWGDAGAQAMAVGFGVLLVALVWWSARELGGDRAALVAAALWTASPLVRDYATDVMSDPPGAVLVLAAFLAARAGRWVLVGAALAGSTWLRLIHVAFLPAVVRRRSAVIAAVLILLPLAAFQLLTYGRLAGYDGSTAEFSLSHVAGTTWLGLMGRASPWPNWQFFPGLLWGLKGGLVPMLPVFAAWELFARRREPSSALAMWVIVANVVVYLPYFFQASRFVLPAACLVIVHAAAASVRLVDRVRSGPAGSDDRVVDPSSDGDGVVAAR